MGTNATTLDRANKAQLQEISGAPTGSTRGNVAVSNPSGTLYVKVNSVWHKNSLGNDLDDAYDGAPAGVPGSGRSITADTGAVAIDNATGSNDSLELTLTTGGAGPDPNYLSALTITNNASGNDYGIKFAGTKKANIVSTTSEFNIRQLADADFNLSAEGTSNLDISTVNKSTSDINIKSAHNLDLRLDDGNDAVNRTMQIIGVNTSSGTADLSISFKNDISITSTAGKLSLNAATSSIFTVTGSAQHLTLGVAGGDTQKFTINSEGTGSDAINLNAYAGGLTIDVAKAISLDAVEASNFTVSGGSNDLTLGARASTITLNESGQESLAGGFSATSIIGALNELTGALGTNMSVYEVTTNAHTVNASDQYAVLHVTYTTTGVCTITFQSAWIAVNGNTIRIKDTGRNAGTYNISIVTQGTELIEDSATGSIQGNSDCWTLQAFGGHLYVL